MVNGVFIYWWLIMSYQELIACTVASLSTAWRPATGHWLHTSQQSLLFQYVPVFTPSSISGSFSCYLLHLHAIHCVIAGGHFLLQIIKRTWRSEGFSSWISFFFFIRPVNFFLSLHFFLFHVSSSSYLSITDLFFLYLLSISYNICISLSFLILCSHLQTSDPEPHSSPFPPPSIHPNIFALPLSHTPLHLNLSPPLFYLW